MKRVMGYKGITFGVLPLWGQKRKTRGGLGLRSARAGRLRPPAKLLPSTVLAALSVRETSGTSGCPVQEYIHCRNNLSVAKDLPFTLTLRALRQQEDPSSWGSALLLMGCCELNLLGHPTCLVSWPCWRLPGNSCACEFWPSHCSRAWLGIFCSTSPCRDDAHQPSMATGGAWLLAVSAEWWAVGIATPLAASSESDHVVREATWLPM